MSRMEQNGSNFPQENKLTDVSSINYQKLSDAEDNSKPASITSVKRLDLRLVSSFSKSCALFLQPPFLTRYSVLMHLCKIGSQIPVKLARDDEEKVSEGKGPFQAKNNLDLKNIIHASRLADFFEGVDLVTQTLWCPAFLGLFSYDLYYYLQFSNKRYQITLRDLFLGISKNYRYASLSTNLFGDIYDRLNYWPWAGVIGISLAAGLTNLALRLVVADYSNLSMVNEHRSSLDKIWQDLITLPFFGSFSRQLATAKQDTLELTIEGPNRCLAPLELIVAAAKNRSFIAKLQAISTLADIDYFLYDNSGSINSDEVKINFDKIREECARSLTAIASDRSQYGFMAWSYANFQLWSIGKSKKTFMNLSAYMGLMPLIIFARLRLWGLVITKAVNLANFLQTQYQCQKETKGVWSYVGVLGNYACLPCDWDFVAYKPNLQGQDCVDGLLSLSRSPQQIFQSLSSVQTQGPFMVMDFHHQNWTDWSKDDWQKIIGLLNTSAFSHVQTLDLSREIPSSLAVEPDFLAVLADYLQFAAIQHLDLSRQSISTQAMMALAPGFRNNSHLVSVGFAQSRLNDSIFNQFVSLISDMPLLSTINISSNQLTGSMLIALEDIWASNTSLTNLDFSNNLLTASDIEQFQLNTTSLRIFDISGSTLNSAALNNFCTSLINSSLLGLAMNYCRLSSQQTIDLFNCIAPSSIRALSLTGNNIGYQELQTISKLLPSSQITDFNLNDNEIDDAGIALLVSPLMEVNSTLARLALAGNPFTAAGFEIFAAALGRSMLEVLELSRVNLGDGSISALMVIPATNLSLTTLDLSNTGLTIAGANQLLLYIANSSVTDLDISRNFLLGEIGTALRAALNSSLIRLNLRGTYINEQDLKSSWPILKNSRLQSLDISENDLGNAVAVALANQMLTPVSNQDEYLNTLVDDIDFDRALSRSSPNTVMTKIDWEDDNRLTALGAAALCRVWPWTGNNNVNLSLSGVNLNPALSGINGCPLPSVEVSAQTSAATSATMISGLLMNGLICLSLTSQLSKANLRLFTAFIGASIATAFGVPGVIMGAVTGYQAGKIFTTASKKFGLFTSTGSSRARGKFRVSSAQINSPVCKR